MKSEKERINSIIEKLSEGLYEKREIIALTFLCSLAGKSIFLFGLPGTAKSLIVRRVASAFKDSVYFGQLMNRFTTPEDVFGPVSLSKLKEDKFERKIEGYLPKADFVFNDFTKEDYDLVKNQKENENKFYSLIIGSTPMFDLKESLFDYNWVYDASASSVKEITGKMYDNILNAN